MAFPAPTCSSPPRSPTPSSRATGFPAEPPRRASTGCALDAVDLLLSTGRRTRRGAFGEYMERLARRAARSRADRRFQLHRCADRPRGGAARPGRDRDQPGRIPSLLQNRKVRARCEATASWSPPTCRSPRAGWCTIRRFAPSPRITTPARRRSPSPGSSTKGIIVIPASGRREHLAANLDALSLNLSAEEAAAIAALDRGDRMINPAKSPDWDSLE